MLCNCRSSSRVVEVVQDKNRALPSREELFQTEDFAPISDARLGEDLQLGHGIQRDSLRIEALDFGTNPLHTVSPSSTSDG